MRRGLIRILCAVVVAVATLAVPRSTVAQTRPAPTTAPALEAVTPGAAVIIELQGEVDDYNRDVLFRRFREAREMGARTIILEVNTYGGLVTAGLDISRFIKQQKDLHIIAFIQEKAISAGAMISLACDEIVMAPHSFLGDSAPIARGAGGGMESLGETERAKVESPILEDFRDSAQRNGYNVLLVESMVNTQRAVHYIQNKAGERRFVDDQQYAALTAGGWQPVPGVRDPVDSKGSLLTVNADLASKLGLARTLAGSPQVLAQDRGINIVAALRPTAGDHIIAWLASGTIRWMLICIFSVALYAALHAPGHGFAEAVAAITLATLLGVPLLTGYAQWWEIIAILLGLALLALEIFVIPGFGVAGVAGVAMFLFGLVMTFVPKEPSGLPGILPSLGSTWQALEKGLIVVVGGLGSSLFLWFWLNRYLPSLPYFRKLILTATSGGAVNAVLAGGEVEQPPATQAPSWPAVGDVGVAVTDLRPGGSASFSDSQLGESRMADVVSDSGYLPAGTRVAVRENHGSYVIVRAVSTPSPTRSSGAAPEGTSA